MKSIEETNEILDKLGYAQHGFGIPKTIEELHDFHHQCVKNTIDKAVLKKKIENICNKDHQNPDYWQCEMKILLEELGLEEEE